MTGLYVAVSTYERCIWLKFVEEAGELWIKEYMGNATMREIEQIYMENCKCEGGH